MLPREHGSWAMLVAPPLVGWAAAGGGPAAAGLLFVLGAAGAFLARTPLTVLVTAPGDVRAWRWLAAYSAAALTGFAGLCLAYGRWGLLLLGLPAVAALGATLWFHSRRRSMSEVNELIGIAGLSLGAPAALFCASGAWGPEAFWLWVLCAVYFSGPVFHVKMLVTRRVALAQGASAQARLSADQARGLSAVVHCGFFFLVGALAAAGQVPWLAALPFAAVTLKTVWWGVRQGPRLDLKRVGWQEIAWTLLFVALVAKGYSA
ncbi:MAG: YwiC-like family protein [Elusimicrobia bacterium]|nr:YwiC-like family protein [Elusimicrobiota bacterium]